MVVVVVRIVVGYVVGIVVVIVVGEAVIGVSAESCLNSKIKIMTSVIKIVRMRASIFIQVSVSGLEKSYKK